MFGIPSPFSGDPNNFDPYESAARKSSLLLRWPLEYLGHLARSTVNEPRYFFFLADPFAGFLMVGDCLKHVYIVYIIMFYYTLY